MALTKDVTACKQVYKFNKNVLNPEDLPIVGASYQEERSVTGFVFYVRECLTSQCTTGDVECQSQGQVVLGINEEIQIGAENPSHSHFYLLTGYITELHNVDHDCLRASVFEV